MEREILSVHITAMEFRTLENPMCFSHHMAGCRSAALLREHQVFNGRHFPTQKITNILRLLYGFSDLDTDLLNKSNLNFIGSD